MELQVLAVAFLATTAVGGLAWVFLYPTLSGETRVEKRKETFVRQDAAPSRVARVSRENKSKRDQVEESLKEIERRQKNIQKRSLIAKIAQAGLSWTKQQYVMFCAASGLAFAAAGLMFNAHIAVVGVLGFVGAFGFPNWFLNFKRKRREKAFLKEFPNSVDVIVRGIKAGLPIIDCLKVIASEAQEPVRTEFRHIVELQALGMPLSEVVNKLYERMPLPEANFFAIVISIQQKAGGNLSETLGNLSKVLRDRKKMRAKIAAMSMEAKASASIIASLPPVVMFLVYLSSPGYMDILWESPTGRAILAGCLIWMLMGVLIMKKMINFDF
jgi:tight adherence protein B